MAQGAHSCFEVPGTTFYWELVPTRCTRVPSQPFHTVTCTRSNTPHLMHEPKPLSAFFVGGSSLKPSPATRQPAHAPPCLLAPTFLGVHTLSLGVDLLLDNGALLLRTGAALHGDSTGDVLQGFKAQFLADRVDGPAPPSSGTRVLGGAFLRAALQPATSESALHIWLNPTVCNKDETVRPQPPVGLESTDATAGLHVCWPYRLRVISAEVLESAADVAGLKATETLEVCVAVDKVRVAAAELSELTLPLPQTGAPAVVWLSTQGDIDVTFGAAAGPVASEPSATKPPPPSEVASGRLPPLPSLPPLPPLPRSGTLGSSSPVLITARRPLAAAELDQLSVSLHVSLHVRPRRSTVETTWDAELVWMSLGEHEEHGSTLLQVLAGVPPDAEPSEAAATAPLPQQQQQRVEVRFGRYAIRVLQCVGHHASGLEAGAVLSKYPLLLLHVQLEVSRVPATSLADEEDEDFDEARELGDALERLLG